MLEKEVLESAERGSSRANRDRLMQLYDITLAALSAVEAGVDACITASNFDTGPERLRELVQLIKQHVQQRISATNRKKSLIETLNRNRDLAGQ
jgi:CMP-2-keto-3-deoxyoctulosonic acid synthetase